METNGNGSGNGRREVDAYPYVDEHGELLFEVVHFDPKDFRQRRPDGRGGWEWNLRGTRRVLDRLPRVLEAVEAGATIYVAEGGWDVHALERAGADVQFGRGRQMAHRIRRGTPRRRCSRHRRQ